jgi:hypothetical protein
MRVGRHQRCIQGSDNDRKLKKSVEFKIDSESGSALKGKVASGSGPVFKSAGYNVPEGDYK